MSGQRALPPHRAKGSWTPRLAGVAVVVVVAGGALAVYLGTTTAPHKVTHVKRHPKVTSAANKVVSMQTVGIIDFGPDDDGDSWQNDPDDHPLMLMQHGRAVDFIGISRAELSSGTPEWTADQMRDGSQIFIYVPTGKCLSPLPGGRLQLTHCDLGLAQRWQVRHTEVVLGQAIAQYANAQTGGCLTAPKQPGPATLTPCGKPRTKTQEIAFWWSA